MIVYRILAWLAAGFLLLPAAVHAAVDPMHPPDEWRAITYSPRRHSYFRMLHDWNQMDCRLGACLPVSEMVRQDLDLLARNGFNVVHLYLWDRELLTSSHSNEYAGFCPAPAHPAAGPGCNAGTQWQALQSFVSLAEDAGLYVALHFASGRFLTILNSGVDPLGGAAEFAHWAESFIAVLQPRRNILLWGLNWAAGPDYNPAASRSVAWTEAYFLVDQAARRASPNPGSMGLIGTNMVFSFNFSTPLDPIVPRQQPFGFYSWDWQHTQEQAKVARDLLTARYGYPKDPDIYLIQTYSPNAADLSAELRKVSGPAYDPARSISVPANRLFVTEFATSSALAEPGATPQPHRKGNNTPSWGDANTPVTTLSGQAQWLNNVLCAYRGAGIRKAAYWALYDPYDLWSGWPWNMFGTALAWNGYWGLGFQSESDGWKPAWALITGAHRDGVLSCPATAPAIVSLRTDNDYYTVGQPVGLIWTTSDITTWSFTGLPSSAPSFLCDNFGEGRPVAGYPAGSCAHGMAEGASAIGSKTYSFSGVGVSSASASATANIGAAPTIDSVLNAQGSGTFLPRDTIILRGNGFSVQGGNALRFTPPGAQPGGPGDVWMWEDGRHYFWQGSYREIQVEIGDRLTPGVWSVAVLNSHSSQPSAAFPVTIIAARPRVEWNRIWR